MLDYAGFAGCPSLQLPAYLLRWRVTCVMQQEAESAKKDYDSIRYHYSMGTKRQYSSSNRISCIIRYKNWIQFYTISLVYRVYSGIIYQKCQEVVIQCQNVFFCVRQLCIVLCFRALTVLVLVCIQTRCNRHVNNMCVTALLRDCVTRVLSTTQFMFALQREDLYVTSAFCTTITCCQHL